MRKYHSTIFLLPVIFALTAGFLFAEEEAFAPIKSELSAIARQNKELAQQNKTLRIQLVGLQLELESREEELRDLDPGFRSPLTVKREQTEQPMTSQVYKELERAEDAELMQEAQEIFLSGQHLDLDDEQRLKELELYDLQIHKQELELDLKEKSRILNDIDEQRRLEFEAVEREAKIIFKKEEDARRRLADAEKAHMAYPQDIELLEMENETLRAKIEELRDKLTE